MNTEKQKIYTKLFKSKKTDLREVKLSKLAEIEEALQTSGIVYYVLEESGFSEAYDNIRNADDFIDHQFHQDYMYAEELIDELETSLSDLGIEYPDELVQYRNDFEAQKEAINELIDLIAMLKNNIGGQTKY